MRPYLCQDLDESLDGSQGSNRADLSRLQIEARTDQEALRHFLKEYDCSAGTARIYEREADRLGLWSVLEKKKPLSSLTRGDFEDYLNFLSDPQPAQTWCAPKAPRGSEQWRPFVGPLSESAIVTAIASVNSMMGYLVDAGYLDGNPLGLIRQKRRKMAGKAAQAEESSGKRGGKTTPVAAQPNADKKVERFFDEDMWSAITAEIEAMPRDGDEQIALHERTRFVCSLLYLMAPRAGELETHRMNSFREERGLWWWNVVGKGAKEAKVPVPDDMITAMVRYRKHLGLSAVPGQKDTTPLLCSLPNPKKSMVPGRGVTPITARRLNQILKDLFDRAATRLENERPDIAYKGEKLRKGSAHWGRHTSITARVDAGIDERYVQMDARHSDRRTTQGYIHAEEQRWHDESQKHRLNWSETRMDSGKLSLRESNQVRKDVDSD